MKGDGDIKKIIIRVLGIGNDINYQSNIAIYDDRCNVIFKGITKNGFVKVVLPKIQVYKLEATFLNEKIYLSFIPNTDILYIRFRSNMFENPNEDSHDVTLLLLDYYYNLPIERGEMILWQK